MANELVAPINAGFGNEKGMLVPKKHKFIMPEWLKGWIALSPALFFLVVFMIYPIINALMMSFINNFYCIQHKTPCKKRNKSI